MSQGSPLRDENDAAIDNANLGCPWQVTGSYFQGSHYVPRKLSLSSAVPRRAGIKCAVTPHLLRHSFAKSTLLSARLEACDCPHAWLSLDEHDSDLGVFLAYFLGAVRTIFPNALTATQTLLSGGNLPP